MWYCLYHHCQCHELKFCFSSHIEQFFVCTIKQNTMTACKRWGNEWRSTENTTVLLQIGANIKKGNAYIHIWKNCPKEQADEFFWHVSQCLKFRMAMNSVEEAFPSTHEYCHLPARHRFQRKLKLRPLNCQKMHSSNSARLLKT